MTTLQFLYANFTFFNIKKDNRNNYSLEMLADSGL